MSKKLEMRYMKVKESRRKGEFKTIEEACTAHDISPASYHNYKNLDKVKEKLDSNDHTSYVVPNVLTPYSTKSGGLSASRPEVGMYEQMKSEIKSLSEKNEKLSKENVALKELVKTLL